MASIAKLQRSLSERFVTDNTRAIVTLMSHVWSPLIVPVIRRAGVRQVVIVDDTDPHPGDHYPLINKWLLREAILAVPRATCDATAFQERTGWHPRQEWSRTLLSVLDYWRKRVRGDVSVLLRPKGDHSWTN